MPKPEFQVKEQSSKSDAADYRLPADLLQELLQDVSATRPAPSSAACHLKHLTAKLQEIDEQLLAIQNVAENIEQDFPRRGMLDQHYKVHCLYFSLFGAELLGL